MAEEKASKEPRETPSQQYYPPRAPMDLSKLFSAKFVAVFLAVGIIIMLVGAVLCNASAVTDPDATAEDIIDARGIYKAGCIVYNVGLMLFVLMIFLGAMFNETLNPHVRLGMLIVGGVLLGWRGMTLWGVG